MAFHLLPLSGSTSRASSSNKAPATERKRSRTPNRPQPKNKGRGKGKSKKGARGPNVPSALIGKALETPQKKGVSTCQMGAMQPNQVIPVPKGCTSVPSQGALSTIRCKIIVEPKTVSPQKLGCKGNQLATFSP